MLRPPLLITLIFGLWLSLLPRPVSAAWQEFIYSGRDLHTVLADIARKGRLNLIADLPHQRLVKFSKRTPEGELEPDRYFWEETLSQLAIAGHFRVVREGPFFILLPDGKERLLENRMVIRRCPEIRPAPAFLQVARRLLFGSLRAWTDPIRPALYLSGFKDELDLLKMSLESIDSPVYPLRCEFSLADEGGATIASFTIRTTANHPFHVAFTAPAPPSSASDARRLPTLPGGAIQGDTWSWDLSATPRMDFDGNALWSPFRLDLRSPGGARFTLAEPMEARDAATGTRRLMLAGRKISVTGRITAETSTARLPPEDGTVAAPAFERDPRELPYGKDAYESETADDGKPLNLVQEDVPAVQIMERFAPDDDLELICDESASGTVSLFLFGGRPEAVDLIRGVARCKGLDVFRRGRHLAVAPPALIGDMASAAPSPIGFPGYPGLSSAKAIELLTGFFEALGLGGKVRPTAGGAALELSGEPPARRAAHLVLNSWMASQPVFSLGFRLRSSFGDLTHQGKATLRNPLQKGESLPQGSVVCRIQPLDASGEGALFLAFQADGRDVAHGRVQVKGTTRVPAAGSPLFLLEGAASFRLDLEGQTTPPPEPAASPSRPGAPTGVFRADPTRLPTDAGSSPLDAAFDSEF